VYRGMLTILPTRDPGMIRIASQSGIPSCRNATPAAWRKNRLRIAKAIIVNAEKLPRPC
jgi:hypothetical protein